MVHLAIHGRFGKLPPQGDSMTKPKLVSMVKAAG